MTEIRKIDDKVSEAIITSGEYRVSIYTLGAIIHSFSHKDRDIIIGYDSYEPYLTAVGHIAEVVGPYANRICDAEFEMDGTRYVLEKNNGKNNHLRQDKKYPDICNKISGYLNQSKRLLLSVHKHEYAQRCCPHRAMTTKTALFTTRHTATNLTPIRH